MSLNKLTTSSDYLEKQYLNIGCNDIKCSSLEIKGEPVGISFEYQPPIRTIFPEDVDYQLATVLYNTVGDHMNMDFLFFSAIVPSNTIQLIFDLPLPSGYVGSGAGNPISLVGTAVNASGDVLYPHQAEFTADNQGVKVHFLSGNSVQGTFAISMHITCKVVKQ